MKSPPLVQNCVPVLDDDFLAGRLRSVDADVEDVVAGARAVDGEAVVTADARRLTVGQSQSLHPHGARVEVVEDGNRPAVGK